MSSCKSLLFCLIGLILYNWVLCSNDVKKHVVPPSRKSLNRELTKNQFDHVRIDHENISEITKDLLWELTMVKNLEIEHSNVRSIQKDAFKQLSAMKKLSLRHNLLEKIKEGVFNNLDIKELDLSNNYIRTIEDEAFNYMIWLQRISLKNNKIEVFNNSWFEGNYFLYYINFENNRIKALPENILSPSLLQVSSFEVIFSHNNIKKIDENAFQFMWRFKKLYLDHNAIETIENGTFNFVNEIDDLRLDHNKIVCLTVDMKLVKNFNVDENPWDPQCLRSFTEQMNSSVTASPTTTHSPQTTV